MYQVNSVSPHAKKVNMPLKRTGCGSCKNRRFGGTYELGFYIPEDDILHSHRSENLKSYLKCYWLRTPSMVSSDVVPLFTRALKATMKWLHQLSKMKHSHHFSFLLDFRQFKQNGDVIHLPYYSQLHYPQARAVDTANVRPRTWSRFVVDATRPT
jgi:hypothetical protein